ncbi:hypothetical protein FH063_004172 [Azospirillum argentinense]|uniref:Uncharacterized protein n=1 Tax=Azospirillum argentinense TaxID=2970906 RepID=A0A5B0KM71_9PROT|nr:hypothetical protein FH063_004172 [Azospirillum argentinense]
MAGLAVDVGGAARPGGPGVVGDAVAERDAAVLDRGGLRAGDGVGQRVAFQIGRGELAVDQREGVGGRGVDQRRRGGGDGEDRRGVGVDAVVVLADRGGVGGVGVAGAVDQDDVDRDVLVGREVAGALAVGGDGEGGGVGGRADPGQVAEREAADGAAVAQRVGVAVRGHGDRHGHRVADLGRLVGDRDVGDRRRRRVRRVVRHRLVGDEVRGVARGVGQVAGARVVGERHRLALGHRRGQREGQRGAARATGVGRSAALAGDRDGQAGGAGRGHGFGEGDRQCRAVHLRRGDGRPVRVDAVGALADCRGVGGVGVAGGVGQHDADRHVGARRDVGAAAGHREGGGVGGRVDLGQVAEREAADRAAGTQRVGVAVRRHGDRHRHRIADLHHRVGDRYRGDRRRRRVGRRGAVRHRLVGDGVRSVARGVGQGAGARVVIERHRLAVGDRRGQREGQRGGAGPTGVNGDAALAGDRDGQAGGAGRRHGFGEGDRQCRAVHLRRGDGRPVRVDAVGALADRRGVGSVGVAGGVGQHDVDRHVRTCRDVGAAAGHREGRGVGGRVDFGQVAEREAADRAAVAQRVGIAVRGHGDGDGHRVADLHHGVGDRHRGDRRRRRVDGSRRQGDVGVRPAQRQCLIGRVDGLDTGHEDGAGGVGDGHHIVAGAADHGFQPLDLDRVATGAEVDDVGACIADDGFDGRHRHGGAAGGAHRHHVVAGAADQGFQRLHLDGVAAGAEDDDVVARLADDGFDRRHRESHAVVVERDDHIVAGAADHRFDQRHQHCAAGGVPGDAPVADDRRPVPERDVDDILAAATDQGVEACHRDGVADVEENRCVSAAGSANDRFDRRHGKCAGSALEIGRAGLEGHRHDIVAAAAHEGLKEGDADRVAAAVQMDDIINGSAGVSEENLDAFHEHRVAAGAAYGGDEVQAVGPDHRLHQGHRHGAADGACGVDVDDVLAGAADHRFQIAHRHGVAGGSGERDEGGAGVRAENRLKRFHHHGGAGGRQQDPVVAGTADQGFEGLDGDRVPGRAGQRDDVLPGAGCAADEAIEVGHAQGLPLGVEPHALGAAIAPDARPDLRRGEHVVRAARERQSSTSSHLIPHASAFLAPRPWQQERGNLCRLATTS